VENIWKLILSQSQTKSKLYVDEFQVKVHALFMFVILFVLQQPSISKVKVKYTDLAVHSLTCHTATGTHMPHRIAQCYLPPGRADIPTFTPVEAGTRLSDPGWMQG